MHRATLPRSLAKHSDGPESSGAPMVLLPQCDSVTAGSSSLALGYRLTRGPLRCLPLLALLLPAIGYCCFQQMTTHLIDALPSRKEHSP
jgi:hypothetical protein